MITSNHFLIKPELCSLHEHDEGTDVSSDTGTGVSFKVSINKTVENRQLNVTAKEVKMTLTIMTYNKLIMLNEINKETNIPWHIIVSLEAVHIEIPGLKHIRTVYDQNRRLKVCVTK